jgi:hypothetical protein
LAGSIPFKSNANLHGSYVQDASAPKTDGLLWIHTCISSTQVKKPFGSKLQLSPLETAKFPFKI